MSQRASTHENGGTCTVIKLFTIPHSYIGIGNVLALVAMATALFGPIITCMHTAIVHPSIAPPIEVL